MEKNILCKHGLEDVIKIAMLFKANYRVKVISVNIPILFLQKCKILKFLEKYKGSQISKTIIKTNNIPGEFMLLDLNLLQSYNNQKCVVLV